MLAALAIILAAIAAAIVATATPGDPALYPAGPGEIPVPVHVVDHGYHAGLVIPRAALQAAAERGSAPAALAVARRFERYGQLEFGWGDEHFYRFVPRLSDLSFSAALLTMLGQNDGTVLHVVGFDGEPQRVFRADIVRLDLSERGFARLVAGLDATFAREAGAPLEIGPGNYGPSLFYRAVGRYHALNVCNHWIERLLGAAGVPTIPVLATYPATLVMALRRRGGGK